MKKKKTQKNPTLYSSLMRRLVDLKQQDTYFQKIQSCLYTAKTICNIRSERKEFKGVLETSFMFYEIVYMIIRKILINGGSSPRIHITYKETFAMLSRKKYKACPIFLK